MMTFDIVILFSVIKIRLMEDLEYTNFGEQYWLVSSIEYCLAV